MAAHIYLDESGDTGWVFNQPYTSGGSSRYLVIAASLVPPDKDHKPERMLRHMYQHRKWRADKEKKWVQMSLEARTDFAKSAAKLVATDPDIKLYAIVVDKQNVLPHIRQDPNKLYNYMVKLLLIEVMARHDHISFIPDPRSLKVGSGNSLHDYLQTELWFVHNALTRLETIPRDSRHCLNLQFTDMLAGVIQSHFEFGESRHWEHLREHVDLTTLYFR
jgi:hypothetical protein